jgi:monoamine oxidase
MGQGARVGRRGVLAAGAAAVLTSKMSGCSRDGSRTDAIASATWVGASADRGHRLRGERGAALPTPAVQRRTDVLLIGAGIAGLAAARALRQGGIEDIALLELEDAPGGNSRGHALAGLRCPLGAHYLPVPTEPAREVAEWLHEIGLLQHRAGRSVPDERHLCHSLQERLFIDGAWHDGLLPPAERASATQRQYQAFAREVAAAQRLGFALPTRRAPWTSGHAALDAQTFSAWLDQRRLSDPKLRWYLDYACRDDYGAGTDTVSAWAGLHYFASRHGFHAPGDETGERDAVFTWPEGNAWLAERLAAPLRGRLHAGRTVLRVREERHGVEVLAIDEATGRAEGWSARAALLCVPLFIAARVLETPLPALGEALALQRRAPWLVANLHLSEPLLDRGIGAPPAWDNVAYGGSALGYVDAGHQRLDPRPAPTVITSYRALTPDQRGELLSGSAALWARRVVDELLTMHPDLPDKLQQVALMRYGHAMSVPVPGLRASAALAALAAPARPGAGRVQFAHADLAGYSVFEEAFTSGDEAGRALALRLRGAAVPSL